MMKKICGMVISASTEQKMPLRGNEQLGTTGSTDFWKKQLKNELSLEKYIMP